MMEATFLVKALGAFLGLTIGTGVVVLLAWWVLKEIVQEANK